MEVEFNFNGRTLTIQCNEYDIIGQIFQNFAIKIGNLLPSNFETDKGMSLFNKFY